MKSSHPSLLPSIPYLDLRPSASLHSLALGLSEASALFTLSQKQSLNLHHLTPSFSIARFHSSSSPPPPEFSTTSLLHSCRSKNGICTLFYPNLPLPLFIQPSRAALQDTSLVQPAISRPFFSTLLTATICLLAPLARAHEPKPETVAAFDHYREKTEERMDADLLASHFLYIDRFPDPRRQEIDAQLHRGEFFLEQLHTLDDGHNIHVPGGIIHHWIGIAFLPGVTLAQT